MHFAGVAYRAHDPRWSFQPLSGEGARLHGGRFNRPGMPALYLSLSPTTALAEANRGFTRKLEPTTLVAYDVDCELIGDLTDDSFRREYRVEPTEIVCDWLNYRLRGEQAPSWQLADRLMASGLNGILALSQVAGASEADVNLVLWRWSARPPCRITVHDPAGRLPKSGKSWEP